MQSLLPSRLPKTRFKPAPASSAHQSSIVVLDDNTSVLGYLYRTFGETYRLSLHEEASTFLTALSSQRKPDLIVFSWNGYAPSHEFLISVRLSWPDIPLLIFTCTVDTRDCEVFSSLGVCGIVLKPFEPGELQRTFSQLLPAFEEDQSTAPEVQLDHGHTFVRSSKQMREIEAQARMVARSDIPVLILGESGTGKEILALFTHKMSLRSNRMFLKINCAAMPAELLESELFGYEQGAFTGAMKMKPGTFEICDRGTIFLDEIGELPAALQAKLLQVLQDGTYSRLGGRTMMRSDVRIIAATNIDMQKAMKEKTFREDLYYRINGISLKLPPLRERSDEILVFANYFMQKASKKYGFEPLPLSKRLLTAFKNYSWPGNLREMENVVNRYLILRDELTIIKDITPTSPPVPVDMGAESIPSDTGSSDLKKLTRSAKGVTEKAAIKKALEEMGWNRKAAASLLQISYKAILYKMKEYDLSPASSWVPTA